MTTNGHANRSTVGVTPAMARRRATSLLPVPVATRYGGGRNNSRAHGKKNGYRPPLKAAC